MVQMVMVDKELKEALVGWIGELKPWNYLLTLTFADRNGVSGYKVGMQRSGKAARRFTLRASEMGADALLVEERGELQGRLHWHGLLSVDGGENSTERQLLVDDRLAWLTKEWRDKEGFVKVELMRSVEAGVRYITKYMCKGFECGRFVSSMDKGEVA